MAMTIRQLHPLFCAEIGGVDTGRPMDDGTSMDSRRLRAVLCAGVP